MDLSPPAPPPPRRPPLASSSSLDPAKKDLPETTLAEVTIVPLLPSSPWSPSEGGDRSGKGGQKNQRVNWSFWETVVLLDAKRKESDENFMGGGMLMGMKSRQPVVERWAEVSAYCASLGVRKSGTQCWHRWDKLWPKFKRILNYEQIRSSSVSDSSSSCSYWRLIVAGRKIRGLPDSFSHDLFDAMAERFGPDRAPSWNGPYKFMADKIVDKISSSSALDRKANQSSAASEEAINTCSSELPLSASAKKRKRENESLLLPKDFPDNITQLAPYIERVEMSRVKFFEHFLERVTALFRDKLTSDERSMAKISSALNRVADALNNVAATMGANNL